MKDVESGEVLEDKVEFCKFTGITWTHDDKGFFYARYPAIDESIDKGTETNANEYHQLWYHRIGTSQNDDVLIMSDDEQPVGLCVVLIGRNICSVPN